MVSDERYVTLARELKLEVAVRNGKLDYSPNCLDCDRFCMKHSRGMTMWEHVVDEEAAGWVNGVNRVFTLAHEPMTRSLKVTIVDPSGREIPTTNCADWKLAGNVLHLNYPIATGSKVLVDYLWRKA